MLLLTPIVIFKYLPLKYLFAQLVYRYVAAGKLLVQIFVVLFVHLDIPYI